jgi:hypothetical protein
VEFSPFSQFLLRKIEFSPSSPDGFPKALIDT